MNRVKVSLPITSQTHSDYMVNCLPDFEIIAERHKRLIRAELDVSDEVEIDTWKYINSALASLSIIADGVFSRVVWDKKGALGGIKFLSKTPPEVFGTGIMVSQDKKLNPEVAPLLKSGFQKIYQKISKNGEAFAILIFYTVSSWFFNCDLIRESTINYFTVVESIASTVTPNLRQKAVHDLKDIYRAMDQLKIDDSHRSLVRKAYILRGEVAHGHPKHLILAQHSLGSHPSSSWSLKEPALECKKAADIFLRAFFELS